MRTDARWRARALAAARHCLAAVGLGIIWLFLSGSTANAAAPSPGDLLGSIASPAASPAPDPARTTAPLASAPAGTTAGLAGGTASAGSAGISPVPEAVAPFVDAPLDPLTALTPVVAGVVSAPAQSVGAAGSPVASLVQHAGAVVQDVGAVVVPVTDPVVQPVVQALGTVPVPAPSLSEPSAAQIEAADGGSAAELPASEAGPEARSSVPATSDGGAAPVDAAVHLAVKVLSVTAAAPVGASGAIIAGDPAQGALPITLNPVLGTVPGTAGGTSSGRDGGPGGLTALGAGGLALVFLLRGGPRLRPSSTTLPASPSFDPGSTPD